MIPIEDKDPIEKLGILKGSVNYNAIQKMLDEARVNEMGRCGMSEKEYLKFRELNSKSVRLDISGIGTKVTCLTRVGDWVDITDYESW